MKNGTRLLPGFNRIWRWVGQRRREREREAQQTDGRTNEPGVVVSKMCECGARSVVSGLRKGCVFMRVYQRRLIIVKDVRARAPRVRRPSRTSEVRLANRHAHTSCLNIYDCRTCKARTNCGLAWESAVFANRHGRTRLMQIQSILIHTFARPRAPSPQFHTWFNANEQNR